MKWDEPQVFSVFRAKLRNRINLSIRVIFMWLVASWAVPAVLLAVGKFTVDTVFSWEEIVSISLCLSLLMTFVLIYENWSKPLKRRIELGEEQITIVEAKHSKVSSYTEFVGYSIFDVSKDMEISEGLLLVFGHPEGKNVSIGVPDQTHIEKIGSYLSGKIEEMSNDEVPEPKLEFHG